MHPLLCLSVLWLLPLALTVKEDSPLDCVPRKSVPFHRVNALMFYDQDVFNYSTMLLREDLDVVVVGAREALYALNINNITKKHSSVKWKATEQKKSECQITGKDPKIECLNYIRILHRTDDNRMYVCGTNAFDPKCDYMSYAEGNLTLEGKVENGRGKCPFDPSQRYASTMVDNTLYSATFQNFRATEPVIRRSSPAISTEFGSSWLNNPRFVSMAQMPASEKHEEEDDDKVYVFFSEKPVECDCYKNMPVSRVARVCKGDLGGLRIMSNKWTTFLKARIDCPMLESQVAYIIQDTFLLCEPQQHWKNCLFYAIFTPPSDMPGLSAVCAYKVSEINAVFAQGTYKTPHHINTALRWLPYNGEVPFPRPGACINNETREVDIYTTRDLPDKTLSFVKKNHIMDPIVLPVGKKPLLVRRGAAFTRIIVSQVQAADGEKYHVMFIGTEDSKILKAVNYDGEMFIIEELELFQVTAPIKILKMSNVTGQLYAGSDYGVTQIPLASCETSLTCLDCVLARDPYCGWDNVIGKCIALSNSQRELIQSVKEGDASPCPDAAPVKPLTLSFWPGANLKLSCLLSSNLAKIRWEKDNFFLGPSTQLQFLQDGLLILNASTSSSGWYRCLSVEHSKMYKYTTTMAEYKLTVDSCKGGGPSVIGPLVVVGLLLFSIFVLLAWNFYKGHLPLPWNCMKQN